MLVRLLHVGFERLRFQRVSVSPTLTRREQAVVRRFVGGSTVHEIAKELMLGTRSVEQILERAADKLQLPNRENLSFLARSADHEITRSRQALEVRAGRDGWVQPE
jgi:DNA-binding NarL/FixJ family response regulator